MKTFINCLVFFLTIISSGQTTISGKISDSKNNPIANANVFLEGSYDGANSDALGEFSFSTTASGNQILIVSSLTYRTIKIPIIVAQNLVVNIVLKQNMTQLNEVVITAGTIEAGDKSRVSVLKPLDILTTAGNPGDIVSALQTLPGTQVVGESGRLFVRGGEANETQTFIDGIRVAQPYIQTTNNVPTRSTFSPLLFKGTSFSTGGYSAEYGEALSSILVMNTIDVPEIEKTEVSVMTVGMGVGTTQKWGENSLSVNTSYLNLVPYQFLMPDNINWIKPFESIGGEAVYRRSFERGLFKVYTSYTAARLDVELNDINFPNKLRNSNSNTNLYSNTSYKGRFGVNWKVFGGLSYAYSRNEGAFDVIQYDAAENAIHAKLNFTKPISDWLKTSFGADYFYTKFSQGVTSFDAGYNSKIMAAFSETDILVSRNFVAKVGIRFTQNYLLNEISIAPRLAFAYKLAKSKQFSFAYGNFEQTPRNEYLIYTDQLKSERAQHYILNYEYNKDRQIFRAEIYHKNYHNLVKFDTNAPRFNSIYDNNGKGYANGLELFWRDNKNIKNLEYWASYSFIDSKRDYQNFPKAVTPNFVADHTFSLVTKYWVQEWRSQLGATYTFASGRPYNDPNSNDFMGGKTKTFNNLSVNWAYLISPQKILFFSVTNVLGFNNVFGYNYSNNRNSNTIFERQAITPTADRFFFVGYFWTISKDQKVNQLENL